MFGVDSPDRDGVSFQKEDPAIIMATQNDCCRHVTQHFLSERAFNRFQPLGDLSPDDLDTCIGEQSEIPDNGFHTARHKGVLPDGMNTF